MIIGAGELGSLASARLFPVTVDPAVESLDGFVGPLLALEGFEVVDSAGRTFHDGTSFAVGFTAFGVREA